MSSEGESESESGSSLGGAEAEIAAGCFRTFLEQSVDVRKIQRLLGHWPRFDSDEQLALRGSVFADRRFDPQLHPQDELLLWFDVACTLRAVLELLVRALRKAQQPGAAKDAQLVAVMGRNLFRPGMETDYAGRPVFLESAGDVMPLNQPLAVDRYTLQTKARVDAARREQNRFRSRIFGALTALSDGLFRVGAVRVLYQHSPDFDMPPGAWSNALAPGTRRLEPTEAWDQGYRPLLYSQPFIADRTPLDDGTLAWVHDGRGGPIPRFRVRHTSQQGGVDVVDQVPIRDIVARLTSLHPANPLHYAQAIRTAIGAAGAAQVLTAMFHRLCEIWGREFGNTLFA